MKKEKKQPKETKRSEEKDEEKVAWSIVDLLRALYF